MSFIINKFSLQITNFHITLIVVVMVINKIAIEGIKTNKISEIWLQFLEYNNFLERDSAIKFVCVKLSLLFISVFA